MPEDALRHVQERQKKRKKCELPEFSTMNMETAGDDGGNDGHLIFKRKVHELQELEGSDEKDLSRKERKRLRRLAKEKAQETGSPETQLGVDSRKKKREPKKHTMLGTFRHQQNPLNEQKMAEPTSTKVKKRKINHQEASIVTPTPSTSLNSTAATTPAPPSEACPDVATYLLMNRISIHTPPNENPTNPILTFGQLEIPSILLNTLLSQGFEKPTPIQACAWPALIKGKDVVGVAETGSGKTLAFGIPAFVRLLHARSQATKKKIPAVVSVLVIAPTRELAIQTYETLDNLGRPCGVGSVCVYGGVDKDSQRRKLQGMGNDTGELRIVVGTPGRLLDFVQEGCLDLSRVTYLVLDEADRMLDRGFENDIRHIIEQTMDTSKRQTVMFSATWPESVRRLANTFQQDPIRITVGSEDLTANCRIEQVVEVLDDSRSKDSRLLNDLRTLLPKNPKSSPTRVLVFALYKIEASRLTQTLERNGYTVSSLHGSLSQPQRIAALHEFKTGNTSLLVATDVAARGLDIPEVEVVINYTFPLTIEDYVHRIGRTGRAGRTGKSITYFTGEKHEYNLAGQLAKVLHESGFECEGLKKFPMTIKKKVHGAYGAFFKETSGAPVAKKIRF